MLFSYRLNYSIMETAFEPKLITPAFVIDALNWRLRNKDF